MTSSDSILLCQEIGNKTPFYGNVKKCEWDGTKFKEGERFPSKGREYIRLYNS